MHVLFIAFVPVTLRLAGSQQATRTGVPARFAVSEREHVTLAAHAAGSQIWVCQSGNNQKLAWILKAPEAELFDSNGSAIGQHFAGPTSKHLDGSEVVGKEVARQDSPDANATP
jgi:hypothetical protein